MVTSLDCITWIPAAYKLSKKFMYRVREIVSPVRYDQQIKDWHKLGILQ